MPDMFKNLGWHGSLTEFILVAPKIPENLKLILVEEGLEYKEINF